jgi:hypothetical protein
VAERDDPVAAGNKGHTTMKQQAVRVHGELRLCSDGDSMIIEPLDVSWPHA